VADALATVEAVRKGRDGVRETAKVPPVDPATVEATLPYLPPPVAALVKLQLLAGARGKELFPMRTRDIDRNGDVWRYEPSNHKTAHHGHTRVIYFGPQAQEVLAPSFPSTPTATCSGRGTRWTRTNSGDAPPGSRPATAFLKRRRIRCSGRGAGAGGRSTAARWRGGAPVACEAPATSASSSKQCLSVPASARRPSKLWRGFSAN
jgi:hypothetical protein